MIINLATIDFNGGGGGGNAKPAVLQEKSIGILQNGSQTVIPDEGYDGLSSVDVNVAITGASSAIDFSSIGYDAKSSAELNSVWNNDVAYSKTLYDKWNPSSISALEINPPYNYELVYYPAYPVEELTDTKNIYCYGCSKMVYFPTFNSDKVRIGQNAFNGCSALTKLDLSGVSQEANLKWAFQKCGQLTEIVLPPNCIITAVEGLKQAFEYCSGLTEVVNFETSSPSGITTIEGTFRGCKALKKIDIAHWDTSLVENTNNTFYGCGALEELVIPENLGHLCTSWSYFLADCTALKTITGSISLKGAKSSVSSGGITGYTLLSNLRKFNIRDIGYTSGCTSFDVHYLGNWGVNTDEIPDARQSLFDSLITYSFDRTSAGYSTCAIKLSKTTFALLTDDEKAQITAKGYTVASA